MQKCKAAWGQPPQHPQEKLSDLEEGLGLVGAFLLLGAILGLLLYGASELTGELYAQWRIRTVQKKSAAYVYDKHYRIDATFSVLFLKEELRIKIHPSTDKLIHITQASTTSDERAALNVSQQQNQLLLVPGAETEIGSVDDWFFWHNGVRLVRLQLPTGASYSLSPQPAKNAELSIESEESYWCQKCDRSIFSYFCFDEKKRLQHECLPAESDQIPENWSNY